MSFPPPAAGRGPGLPLNGPRRPFHLIAATADLTAALALVGVVVAAPWWFGGVQAPSQVRPFSGVGYLGPMGGLIVELKLPRLGALMPASGRGFEGMH